jgi:putative membrane protein
LAKKIEPAVTAALTDAVRELELCSCAEVVIEIRSRSGSYAHADARFAALIAFVALIVLLFSLWPFHAGWVVADVAAAWVLGLFLSRKSDSVRHLMTTSRERVAQVHLVAASAFHERGVANTMSESGVLIYLSLLEGRIELLADRGVLAAVPPLEWNRIAETARGRRATTETVLEIVRALTPLLECFLPSRQGDVDELGNVPRFVIE